MISLSLNPAYHMRFVLYSQIFGWRYLCAYTMDNTQAMPHLSHTTTAINKTLSEERSRRDFLATNPCAHKLLRTLTAGRALLTFSSPCANAVNSETDYRASFAANTCH